MCAAHNFPITSRNRWFLLIAALSLGAGGCLPPPQHQADRRLYRSVKFDSATDLTILPSDYWDGRGRLELTNVVEIGGQVVYSRGQTLVIDPVYVLTSEAGSTHSLRTKGGYQLPDRVVVVVEPRTRVDTFRLPRNSGSGVALFPFLVPALIAFSVMHHRH
jgi:hypothetical protein